MTLGKTALQVIDFNGQLITALLPQGIAAGDYLLTVSSGRGIRNNDSFALTIGAAGPAGPQGEPGPQGARGNRGPEGPQGPIGLTGPQGPRGEIGPQRLQGDRGPQGLAGNDGAPGSQGLPGIDGINCWDLNSDGVNDANEDSNGDGVYNSLDCGTGDLREI